MFCSFTCFASFALRNVGGGGYPNTDLFMKNQNPDFQVRKSFHQRIVPAGAMTAASSPMNQTCAADSQG
jgi:hypothetical protein